MSDWADDYIVEKATGRRWKVLERYLLPGKHTGFVLVCGERACFGEIRGGRWPLGRLPHDISPEDRKAVVEWAVKTKAKQLEESYRHAAAGTRQPNPLDEEVK